MKIPKIVVDMAISTLLPLVIKAAEDGYTPEQFDELMDELGEKIGRGINDGSDKALGKGEVVENSLQRYINAGLPGLIRGINRGCDYDEV